jgi:cobalt-zinc-cadmium efflux system protein
VPHDHCDHGHHHHHVDRNISDGRLVLAIGLNLMLTGVEIAGGIAAGSLALLADALHNFGDCGSLVIALVARRWSRKKADPRRTFGYARAEVVGAVINLTALVIVAIYLVVEAIERTIHPEEINGRLVIAVASVALIVDVGTVLLLWAGRASSVNIRAAVLHNVSDALASVGVIVVGIAVMLWNFTAADVLATLIIAGYMLWQSCDLLKQSIAILMNSAPLELDTHEVVDELRRVAQVCDVHHVHLWQLDEHHVSLEAHVVIASSDAAEMEQIKDALKQALSVRFGIEHSTLEFELDGHAACGQPGQVLADH